MQLVRVLTGRFENSWRRKGAQNGVGGGGDALRALERVDVSVPFGRLLRLADERDRAGLRTAWDRSEDVFVARFGDVWLRSSNTRSRDTVRQPGGLRSRGTGSTSLGG